MMGFKLDKAIGALKHINVRKEGPEEEKVLALDLKMEVEAPAEALQQLVGDEENIVAALYKDEAPRFLSLDELKFHVSFKNHDITIAGLRFRSVDLQKFSARLRDKLTVVIAFQAQVKPRSNEIAILSEYVQEEMTIEVVPPLELDLNPKEGA